MLLKLKSNKMLFKSKLNTFKNEKLLGFIRILKEEIFRLHITKEKNDENIYKKRLKE